MDMFTSLAEFSGANPHLALATGFLLNFAVAYVIIRFIYCRKAANRNFVFTFLAFNSVVYFIMGLFTSIELSIGAGFGLFALFSVLRYRTEAIRPPKPYELTSLTQNVASLLILLSMTVAYMELLL